MDNKEHIDRLYQENFKDFEVTPHPRVWENIEASLQKKKRRILPFWWVSGGAVATLLIGILIFNFSSEKQLEKSNSEEIIITESEHVSPINTAEELSVEKQENLQKTGIKTKVATSKVSTQKTIEKSLKVQNSTKKTQEKRLELNADEIAVVTEKNSTENKQEFSNNKTFSTEKNQPKIEKDLSTKKTKKLIAFEDKEEEKTTKKLPKKWSITPSVAFLNSGSFSKSSPLGATLNNNPISGENTYSYGAKISYKINEKWEVQSGIHLQEVQFSTRNVTFISSEASTNFNINFIRDEELNFSSPTNSPITSKGSEVLAKNATINQSFGYIEIPIEVKYMLFKKSKFSTQLVTGVSSLFLSKNEVGASGANFSGFVGETTNLNTLNFSGNIGFDINYQLFEKLQLNVNPMFKQQFNTFSKNSNGFKPYTIGIYTGIKYEF